MCVTQHIIPYHMSGKKFFGRSAIRDVTDKRLPLLNEYLKVRTLVFFLSPRLIILFAIQLCVCVWQGARVQICSLLFSSSQHRVLNNLRFRHDIKNNLVSPSTKHNVSCLCP